EYPLPTFAKMQAEAQGQSLPNLTECLFKSPGGVWVAPHDDGVLFLTPASAYPLYCYIDNIHLTTGYMHVARRPMTFEGVELFFPGSIWLKHTQCDGAVDFVRKHI